MTRRKNGSGTGGRGRGGDSRVGLKVSVVDGLDELLRDLYDLLLASCGDGNTRR